MHILSCFFRGSQIELYAYHVSKRLTLSNRCAHISDKCHPSCRNDIEKRLDLSEPFEIRSNATRIGSILPRPSMFNSRDTTHSARRGLTLTFRTNNVRQGRSCWTRSSTCFSLSPWNGAGPRSFMREGLARSYPPAGRRRGRV